MAIGKNTILPIDVEDAMEQMQKIQKANADFLQSLAQGQMELVNELIEGTMKHFDSIKNAKNVQEMVELQNQYLSDSAKKITTLGKKFFELYVNNQPNLLDILPTATVTKPAAKKPAAKQVAKKPVAKKPAARKPAAKKPAARKPAAKKPAAKPAAKKPAVKKATTSKKVTSSKPVSKKVVSKPVAKPAAKPAPAAAKPAPAAAAKPTTSVKVEPKK